MTSDDQQFLDFIFAIPNDIKKYSLDVADAVDRHFESVAHSIRESLSHSTWLPASAKPRPPPPPVPRFIPSGSVGYWVNVQRWVSRNRALTAALVAFFMTGGVLVYRQRKGYARKRRARRASNGARREVVIIAGTPNSPITRSLSLDLERRGFIVYVVVSTPEEEQIVQGESRADVRPLFLDVSDPLGAQDAVERFNRLLATPHHAFNGASAHNLRLAGLVMIPDPTFPSGPVEAVSPDVWSDALNVRVLGTVATAQRFLRTVCEFKGRVLILTPNIISSLKPPFHGLESTIVGALEGFTASLRGELQTLGIELCQIKMGTFDTSSVGGRHHLQQPASKRKVNDVRTWAPPARAAYARNYLDHTDLSVGGGLFHHHKQEGHEIKGAPLRELHNAVFDALTQRRPRQVWKVGRGSVLYDFVGNWIPSRMVSWRLGLRQVCVDELEESPVASDDGNYGSQSAQWEKV